MTYPVARYLSIDSTTSPSFTPGGELAFLTDTTGTPQVWSLDAPGEWPNRLTAHDERVSFVEASPTREELVFGMDQGSNERDQLFRYDLADGAETALTDVPEAIHSWGGWAPDGQRFAFAANREETDTFDVYVQGRAETGDDAVRVYEGPGGFLGVESWHPDGDALVLSKAHASFDQSLSLLDVASGERRELTDDVEARYAEAQFGPDGGLYVVTNHGRDTASVARIDPATTDLDVVKEAGAWNVDHLAVSTETGALAYTRNVDGHSELHVGELDDAGELSEITTAELSGGVIHDLSFDPTGEQLAVTRSADDQPFSIYAVELHTGETERWTTPGTLGIPEASFLRSETIRYETFDGREIPAYWTLPDEAPPGGDGDEVPVIVDVHGGPEHQRRPWFYPTKQFFLDQGYAVLEPNVRGSSGYGSEYTHLDDTDKRMDSVADIKHAVKWLRAREDIDDDRIVAYGRSYGGFMVLAAITQYPDLWAAAVDFVGIANFETFLENTGEWRRSHREQEYGALENTALLESISPIHDVDQISCPLFIQHGANDPRVPVGEAKQIAAALEERGIPVETCIFEDEGHHTTDRANRIEEFERIAEFLEEHV